jgi:hypothetical protein
MLAHSYRKDWCLIMANSETIGLEKSGRLALKARTMNVPPEKGGDMALIRQISQE